jgi:hypothetical protein
MERPVISVNLGSPFSHFASSVSSACSHPSATQSAAFSPWESFTEWNNAESARSASQAKIDKEAEVATLDW